MDGLFEYVGTSDKLQHAIVEIERETDKSYFVKYRPEGGKEVEVARVAKTSLKPHHSLSGI